MITSEQREADPMYSQLGMLKRISYPTGGYTMYEYEGNTYSRRAMDQINIRSVAVDKQAGGVRIKRSVIIQKPVNATVGNLHIRIQTEQVRVFC